MSNSPLTLRSKGKIGLSTYPVRFVGREHFELEVLDTGLPMGESDTMILPEGAWRSYLHACYASLGVEDQC